jgi:hypothetical protein
MPAQACLPSFPLIPIAAVAQTDCPVVVPAAQLTVHEAPEGDHSCFIALIRPALLAATLAAGSASWGAAGWQGRARKAGISKSVMILFSNDAAYGPWQHSTHAGTPAGRVAAMQSCGPCRHALRATQLTGAQLLGEFSIADREERRQHSTAQHGTARRGTARHGTAQHSTAQRQQGWPN